MVKLSSSVWNGVGKGERRGSIGGEGLAELDEDIARPSRDEQT